MALIVGGAVVLSLVVAFAAGDFGGDEPEPGTHNDDFRYDWSGAVCDEHGYSGRFTNNDSEDFNGEVWAVATQGRATIARDREAILDLAPGESATVEFGVGGRRQRPMRDRIRRLALLRSRSTTHAT